MPTLSSTFSTLQQSRPARTAAAGGVGVSAGGVPTALAECLSGMELLAPGDTPREVPLDGSRARRVIRVQLGWGTVCVKRVEAVPSRPVDVESAARCATELRWLKVAQSIAPGCVPTVLGEHLEAGAFAMEYLPHEEFPSWQSRLAAGQVEPWVAAEVGHLLGRLHAATAHSPAVGHQFESRAAFLRLRAEPVFTGGAAANPECAWELRRREAAVATARTALVHGDLGPDNILVGQRGPVLLDADCAHFGDPMVDVATLLAGLQVRMAAHTQHRADLAACWDAFQGSYFPHITWEMHEHAEARAAALVPAFTLAALDGAVAPALLDAGSPRLRSALQAMLLAPPPRLDTLRAAWLEVIGEQ